MTRIIVLIKDIPDLSELKIDSSTRRPQTDMVKRKINDLDKRALEAAVKLKEASNIEVVTLSIGDEKTKSLLLEALAIGADSSYLVNDPILKGIDGYATSKLIVKAINKLGSFDLIIAGELSLEGMGSQVGVRVAELLGIPSVTYVKSIKLDDRLLKAVRNLEEVEEVTVTTLPALATVVREINEPRIPSLMNILKAKKKTITEWSLGDLCITSDEIRSSIRVNVIDSQAPLVKRKKIIIKSEDPEEAVENLIHALCKDGIIEV